MRTKRHIILTVCTILSFLLFSSLSTAFASYEKKAPTGLTAKGAVLLDRQSGQILFEQNADERLYPASITKILTAILALENGDLQAMVKTSKLAREQEGNRIYLEYDEEQTLENLLYGLMLNSGNDAAVAIAEHLAGSVERFAELMNRKAVALGARNSHFVTPSGLHDDDHYTTARDMAVISSYAMHNETFRKIVATETLPWKGQVWESVLFNINQMLYEYEGATGIKTGFTDQAQQTIAVSAKRQDRELVAVLMGVENRPKIREEATRLLDYGFDQFINKKIASKGEVLKQFNVEGSLVRAYLPEDVYVTLPAASKALIQSVPKVEPPRAPFDKDAVIGALNLYQDGHLIMTADVLADRGVSGIPIEEVTSATENKLLLLALLIPLLLFFPKKFVKLRKSRSI